MLVCNDVILSGDAEVASAFNFHFKDITKDLDISQWVPHPMCPTFSNPVYRAIAKYEDHPSIIKIRSLSNEPSQFTFLEVTPDFVKGLVLSLDTKKATSDSISPKLLKLTSEISSSYLANSFNAALISSSFPDSLKCASVTPILKKGDATCIENYRPISILPTVSKTFEKIIAFQLNVLFERRFSPLLCGFRKGHSTQHAMLRLLSSWQSSLDKSEIVGTVLMDLSKAYDCIPHDLLIAKLSAYGVYNFSSSFIYNYLSNRKQRVKINDSFSDYVNISIGVPQGSILGPLLFNIFTNDLLFFPRKSDLCNFADDNSLYASSKLLCHLISILKHDIDDILFWFKINQLVANPGKFQVMFLGTKEPVDFVINDILIPVTDSVKLLGIIIDKKLDFKCHTEELCKKATNKTKALFRIRPYISQETAKALYHAFILSTFKYCPLIWMNTGKGNYERLVKVHRRALSAVHHNFSLNFSQLLTLDNEVSLHVYFILTLLQNI